MDLSTSGNVFGLNESLHPTVEDMHERLTDPSIARGVRDTGGRVTLATYHRTKPVIAAINGTAVGIGATMTRRRSADYLGRYAAVLPVVARYCRQLG